MWPTRLRPVSLTLIGITAIALSFTILQIIRPAIFRNHAAFDQMVTSLEGSESNEGLLPVWVSGKPRTMAQPVEAAGRDIQVTSWSATQREFRIGAGDSTEVRLRTFYYPYWKATAEGKQLTTSPANDGALLVSVPPTATIVNVKFVEPTTTHIAGGVSILGLLVIALFFANRFRKRSKEAAV
jgi:hypothetical protein